MAKLGKFAKTPIERKEYSIDYASWLRAPETLSVVAYEFSPPGMTIDGTAVASGRKAISFFAGGGNDGETYELLITVTTSDGQNKEDAVLFVVRDL